MTKDYKVRQHLKNGECKIVYLLVINNSVKFMKTKSPKMKGEKKD